MPARVTVSFHTHAIGVALPTRWAVVYIRVTLRSMSDGNQVCWLNKQPRCVSRLLCSSDTSDVRDGQTTRMDSHSSSIPFRPPRRQTHRHICRMPCESLKPWDNGFEASFSPRHVYFTRPSLDSFLKLPGTDEDAVDYKTTQLKSSNTSPVTRYSTLELKLPAASGIIAAVWDNSAGN